MDAPEGMSRRDASITLPYQGEVRQAVRTQLMTIFTDDPGIPEDRTFTAVVDGAELDFIAACIVSGDCQGVLVAFHNLDKHDRGEDEYDAIVCDFDVESYCYEPRQMVLRDDGRGRPVTDFLWTPGRA